MADKTQHLVQCPVCGADGAQLQHDLRAPLVYSCQRCLHEWQLDPADEPPQEPDMEAYRLTTAPAPNETPAAQQLQPGGPTQSAPFRRVLVCVDGSAMDETVVLHATMVAAAFGAPVTVLRVLETAVDTFAAPPDPFEWEVRQREARAYLDRLILMAGHFVHAEAELIQGRAAPQICNWAQQHGADLSVLASHGEHGRSEWMLSSTAHKLVEGVPGSVLLVPADGEPRDLNDARYRRILVPLDGSARAESVLPIATRLATAHGADLLIAHVPPAPELTRVGPFTAQDIDLQQRLNARNVRVARGYLDQIRARVSEAGVEARINISSAGDARTRLARLVRREGVDLVILSAHGQRGPRDTPCGTVAAHLLTHAAAPLLVFRERPHRTGRRVPRGATGRAAGPRPPAQSEP